MAGRKGRSGGHNKISPADHLLRGTWNVTRHGPRPASVAAAAIPRVEPMPPDVIDGLSGRGLRFVEKCWAMYSGWTPPMLVLLREAGITITAIEQMRGTNEERPAQRALLQIMNALRLE
jgi:hypothetical protein